MTKQEQNFDDHIKRAAAIADVEMNRTQSDKLLRGWSASDAALRAISELRKGNHVAGKNALKDALNELGVEYAIMSF